MTIDELNVKLDNLCNAIEKEKNVSKCMKLYSEGVACAEQCFAEIKEERGKLTLINAKAEDLINE